jgi:hypothetical protein
MFEVALVIGVLAGVIGATSLVALAPWYWLFGVGLALLALGMAVGVPAGFWYHVLLYRLLKPRAALEAGWWLRPFSLHGALTDAERALVVRWSYIGGAGFVAAILGCVLVGVGAWRSGGDVM